MAFGDSGSDQSKVKLSKLGNVSTSFSIPFLDTWSFRSRLPVTKIARGKMVTKKIEGPTQYR